MCSLLSEVVTGYFNPLPPQGGRLKLFKELYGEAMISIHSLPKEGDYSHFEIDSSLPFISIHSLPKEGDVQMNTEFDNSKKISIHSLPKEGDKTMSRLTVSAINFNPLPPQGGRPTTNPKSSSTSQFQSTPSPRRETVQRPSRMYRVCISIHSLPKEGDSGGDVRAHPD